MGAEVNMAIHIRRRWEILAAGVVLLIVADMRSHAVAQSTANFYSTRAAAGSENYAVIINAGVAAPEPVRLISACNYNAAAPEVVMVFDANALPANGAVPMMELPLPESGGSNAPACGSFSMPDGGVTLYHGLVIAASTTGKTLTVDTANGGNTFFEVAR